MADKFQTENQVSTHIEEYIARPEYPAVKFVAPNKPNSKLGERDVTQYLSYAVEDETYVLEPLLNLLKDPEQLLVDISGTLGTDQHLVFGVEIIPQRKRRIASRFPNWLYVPVAVIDFIFTRFLPKLRGFRGFFKRHIRLNNQPISLCSALGCAVFAGFEIEKYDVLEKVVKIYTKRNGIKPPNDLVSAGIMFSQKRVGRNREIIRIFKLRTMHKYADQIQNFVIEKNGLNEMGKIADDFRVTDWGRFMRKTWLDELPQLINVMRGEIKLVGIRPISEDFFNRYPEDLKTARSAVKPGCIPPVYYERTDTFEDILESERRYLRAYAKHPLLTDLRYFTGSIFNIIFRGARSK